MARKPPPTKVILPQRRKDLFTRQRLINLLYDLMDEKLVLVIAPAGYGKTSLLIDFASQVDSPVCWYAVDELDQTAERFINESAENCHLILSSRPLLSLPNLPLLVARSQVGGMGFEELAFRADEIQSFVLQYYHVTLSVSAAPDLARDSEGWITGLMLSAQVMGQGLTNQMRADRAAGIELYAYLSRDILDATTAER